jgi:hypothetical protein
MFPEQDVAEALCALITAMIDSLPKMFELKQNYLPSLHLEFNDLLREQFAHTGKRLRQRRRRQGDLLPAEGTGGCRRYRVYHRKSWWNGGETDRDICELETINKLIAAAIREFGRLDIVVSNAVYQMSQKGIEEITPEELDHTFHTSVFGAFLLTQAALKNATSRGSDPEYNLDSSLRSKSAACCLRCNESGVLSMTTSIADLAIKQGTRVNAVAPRPVWTPLAKDQQSDPKAVSRGIAGEKPPRSAHVSGEVH